MTPDSQGGPGTTPPPELGDEPSPDPDGTADRHRAPGASAGLWIGLWIVVAAVIAASAIIALLVS